MIQNGVQRLKALKPRQMAHQFLNLLAVGLSALMIWKGLMIVTNTESPVVVVLSGSMEPQYHRGDLLFLWQDTSPYVVGEVVVFKLFQRDIPIVHRVIKVHEKPDGSVEILTKGDNNQVDDTMLYTGPGQRWITQRDIIGRCKGFLPYLGMVTVVMNDYPMLKFALLAGLALFVLSAREN
eukprot:comp9815_c0_seq1/m.11475 comp9815_c0_seq1/g.11475  ORF comp9815_c0_seq1/g.11475 comp9815_c0_seq1/m.11475 type:complete len:180 (-) comp9815_c0_seq1:66-605(-)